MAFPSAAPASYPRVSKRGQGAIGVSSTDGAVRSQASKIHKDCASDLDAGCNKSRNRGKKMLAKGARRLASVLQFASNDATLL